MQKYTSFQMHERHTDARQLLTFQNNLLALYEDSVRCWSKYGLRQFVYTSPILTHAQAMTWTSEHSVLVGGHQKKLFELDVATQRERRIVDAINDCCILRMSPKFVCAGSSLGKVRQTNNSRTFEF